MLTQTALCEGKVSGIATAIPHGTPSGYLYHKCRCDECRVAEVARVAAWRAANPERRKTTAAKERARNRAHRRKMDLARYYRLMETDPERVRRQRREYAKTPHGRLIYRNAQERRRRGAPYTKEALDWIGSLVDPRCGYCDDPATEIDHIVPVSRGGSGERVNLVPACRSCNARKGDQTAEEFMAGLKEDC